MTSFPRVELENAMREILERIFSSNFTYNDEDSKNNVGKFLRESVDTLRDQYSSYKFFVSINVIDKTKGGMTRGSRYIYNQDTDGLLTIKSEHGNTSILVDVYGVAYQ
ncbi:uncharacterized protein LOC135120972 [Zophobas morio]|uniref:uncharacterized protein LOC135120972 n=1 Tax=Zophobas morio TaxID=2755281 RepID=UPI0030828CAA